MLSSVSHNLPKTVKRKYRERLEQRNRRTIVFLTRSKFAMSTKTYFKIQEKQFWRTLDTVRKIGIPQMKIKAETCEHKYVV